MDADRISVVSRIESEIHPGVFEREVVMDLGNAGTLGFVVGTDRLAGLARVAWLLVADDGLQSAGKAAMALE